MSTLSYENIKVAMKIDIAVADTVPDDAFARIERLARGLPSADSSFRDAEIIVRRTPMDTVQTMVTDEEYSRQKLVEILVEQALTGGSDSLFGAL
ncbi:hypothetical protein LJR129_003877 [Acidovorax sp. LjRoot129]|uniref:hypothetical protein n=1 Tax=Acidovorax sp. LjRoot129 TaxID=3342260 RepID=UPI003ECD93C6